MGKYLLYTLTIFLLLFNITLGYEDADKCKTIIDSNTGFTKLQCDRIKSSCSVISEADKEIIANKCDSIGLSFTIYKNSNGCESYTCRENQNIFQSYPSCPNEEEIKSIVNTCNDKNLLVYMERSGGCLIPVCKSVFLNGTQRDNCISIGGEYVEHIRNGTIVFSECISKASKTDVTLNPVDNVPNIAELLQLTFKLESVKVELEELYGKSDAIADYYRLIGNTENADKFDKISLMFLNAKSEADKIKTKIAEKVDQKEISKSDITEIRYDVKYLKDVVMRNILFEMLGTKDNNYTRLDCKDNIKCFEESVVDCRLSIFTPGEFKITIDGIDNDNCIIKSEYNGKMMECRIPEYYLGIQDPQEQILPYCKGELVEDLTIDKEVIE